MKIETKFNVGQKVFYLKGTKLIEAEIYSINIEIRKDKINEEIYFRYEDPRLRFEIVSDSMIFRSLEEFVNQITTK